MGGLKHSCDVTKNSGSSEVLATSWSWCRERVRVGSVGRQVDWRSLLFLHHCLSSSPLSGSWLPQWQPWTWCSVGSREI